MSREKISSRIKTLRYIIQELDKARLGVYVDTKKLEEKYSSLKLKEAPLTWDTILNSISAIQRIPTKSPKYSKLIRLNKLANKTLMGGLVGLLVAVIVQLVGQSYEYYLLLMLIVLALTNIAYFLKMYVGHQLDKIYNENKEELEKHGKILKKSIEYLLGKLREEYRKLGVKPSSICLKLKHSDYNILHVVQRPGILSENYKLCFKK
ncbi:MAG TPA: hypothetical protein ENJ59_03245 [Thermofilum sp.]|nr:hypothetical protein [Thermofilum sp.]